MDAWLATPPAVLREKVDTLRRLVEADLSFRRLNTTNIRRRQTFTESFKNSRLEISRNFVQNFERLMREIFDCPSLVP